MATTATLNKKKRKKKPIPKWYLPIMAIKKVHLTLRTPSVPNTSIRFAPESGKEACVCPLGSAVVCNELPFTV